MVMEMTWKRYNELGKNAIDSVTHSIGDMFTESIAHSQNFWQAFTSLGRDAIASITRFTMENLMKGLLAPLQQGIGRRIAGVGDSLSSALGGRALAAVGLGGLLSGSVAAAAPGVATIGTSTVITGTSAGLGAAAAGAA